jgi:hypothetical protein
MFQELRRAPPKRHDPSLRRTLTTLCSVASRNTPSREHLHCAADRNFKRHSAGRREFPHCCLALQERAIRSTAAPPAGGYASPGLCTRAPRAGQLGQAAQDGGGPLGDPRGGRPWESRFWESWVHLHRVSWGRTSLHTDYTGFPRCLDTGGYVVPTIGDDRWLKSPSCRRGIGSTK